MDKLGLNKAQRRALVDLRRCRECDGSGVKRIAIQNRHFDLTNLNSKDLSPVYSSREVRCDCREPLKYVGITMAEWNKINLLKGDE